MRAPSSNSPLPLAALSAQLRARERAKAALLADRYRREVATREEERQRAREAEAAAALAAELQLAVHRYAESAAAIGEAQREALMVAEYEARRPCALPVCPTSSVPCGPSPRPSTPRPKRQEAGGPPRAPADPSTGPR